MRFIDKCLHSVLATDYPNFEVIFVDDGSTDGSLEYAKKTFGHDKRLKVIKNPKKLGLAASRNVGIRVATGDYIAFIETDMEVEPDWLKEALKILASYSSIGGVYCKVRDINERDRIQAAGLLILPHTGWVVNIGLWEKDLGQFDNLKDTMAGAVGLVVKRKVIDLIGNFDEKLTHNIDDIDYCWRIWLAGYRIVTAPKAIVYHWTFKPSKIRELTISERLWEYHFNKALRMIFKNYEAKSLLKYFPACLVLHFLRAIVNIFKGNVVPIYSLFKVIYFFLVNMRDNVIERHKVQRIRRFRDQQLLKRFAISLNDYFSYIKKVKMLTYQVKSLKEDNKQLSLDIGAGENPRGDINVDIRVIKGINVVCHALYLPFRGNCFSHVYLSHVLEHFTYREGLYLLNEINRVLRKKGTCEIWIPNFQAIAVLFAWISGKPRKSKNGSLMVLPMLSGDQDYAENVHKSLWTVKLLKLYLNSAGFRLLRVEGESRIPLLKKFLPNRCVVIHTIAEKVDV